MATFPTLTGGGVMRLTSSVEKRWGTEVLQFDDDSEQRWTSHGQLVTRTLVLRSMSPYDLANVLEFWRSMKGRFDSTWDIEVEPGVFEFNMAFDDDEFRQTETKPGRFDVTLKVIQVRPE